jgi:hypothetical protein
LGRKSQYNHKQRPKGESLIPGQKCVVNTSLIKPPPTKRKVYLLLLQTKLELTKRFVEKMDRNDVGFMNLKKIFPRINDGKIKEWVFFGPQIRELIKDVKFEDQLRDVEKSGMEIIQICHFQFWGEIKRQGTIVIRWLTLFNSITLWGVLKVSHPRCVVKIQVRKEYPVTKHNYVLN